MSVNCACSEYSIVLYAAFHMIWSLVSSTIASPNSSCIYPPIVSYNYCLVFCVHSSLFSIVNCVRFVTIVTSFTRL